MKLDKPTTGHGLIAKLKLGAMTLSMGTRAPDVVRVLLYRPQLFGQHVAAYVQTLLRGPSEWTVGERELFATFVSHANQCAFCLASHRAVAARAMGEEVVAAVLSDYRSAAISLQVRAMLGFLDKLTREPKTLNASDLEPLQAVGVSDDAIRTAVHICAAFSTINRVADALGFEVPSATAFARMADALLKHGYRMV